MVRLDVKKIIAEGDDAAIFFERQTKAPAAATTLVAEWHQVKNGKIVHVQSAFDGRPFAVLFAGGKRNGSTGVFEEPHLRSLCDLKSGRKGECHGEG